MKDDIVDCMTGLTAAMYLVLEHRPNIDPILGLAVANEIHLRQRADVADAPDLDPQGDDHDLD